MLLDGPDLFHLTQEAPGRPTHTIKVATLDGLVAHHEVRSWLEDAVARMPVLRRRAEVRVLQPTRWVEADADLDSHLVEHRITAEGATAFGAIIAELAERPLERDRPLWALHHVIDEAGGRSHLVFRVHHALADGAASVRLWEQLAERSAGSPAASTEPSAPGRLHHLGEVIADGPRLARRWREHGKRLAVARTTGLAPAVDPFTGPATPFNARLSGPRACAWVDLPLDGVKQVGREAGGSVNDVLLALCGGAIRRLLEADGAVVGSSLTATVPASLPDRRQPFGNAVTTLYVSLHSDEPDVLARVRAVAADVRAAREVSDHDPRLLPDSQRRWRLYQGLVAAMHLEERRRDRPAYNAIVSSVRGPDRLRLLGRDVVELRSLGPLAGRLGLNITAWSYDDTLAVGIHAFRDATTQLERLGDLIASELESGRSPKGEQQHR